MRTAIGPAAERVFDASANYIPGVRMVYNASKTAAETAVGDQDQLQEPVRLEVWDEIRMTRSKPANQPPTSANCTLFRPLRTSRPAFSSKPILTR